MNLTLFDLALLAAINTAPIDPLVEIDLPPEYSLIGFSFNTGLYEYENDPRKSEQEVTFNSGAQNLSDPRLAEIVYTVDYGQHITSDIRKIITNVSTNNGLHSSLETPANVNTTVSGGTTDTNLDISTQNTSTDESIHARSDKIENVDTNTSLSDTFHNRNTHIIEQNLNIDKSLHKHNPIISHQDVTVDNSIIKDTNDYGDINVSITNTVHQHSPHNASVQMDVDETEHNFNNQYRRITTNVSVLSANHKYTHNETEINQSVDTGSSLLEKPQASSQISTNDSKHSIGSFIADSASVYLSIFQSSQLTDETRYVVCAVTFDTGGYILAKDIPGLLNFDIITTAIKTDDSNHFSNIEQFRINLNSQLVESNAFSYEHHAFNAHKALDNGAYKYISTRRVSQNNVLYSGKHIIYPLTRLTYNMSFLSGNTYQTPGLFGFQLALSDSDHKPGTFYIVANFSFYVSNYEINKPSLSYNKALNVGNHIDVLQNIPFNTTLSDAAHNAGIEKNLFIAELDDSNHNINKTPLTFRQKLDYAIYNRQYERVVSLLKSVDAGNNINGINNAGMNVSLSNGGYNPYHATWDTNRIRFDSTAFTFDYNQR